MEIKITDDRFILMDEDNEAGFIEYSLNNNDLTIHHTEVDEAYAGQQLAKKLVMSVVDHAREKNYKIIPLCPYAHRVLHRDESVKDVLKTNG